MIYGHFIKTANIIKIFSGYNGMDYLCTSTRSYFFYDKCHLEENNESFKSHL